MRSSWPALAALLALATGCGEATADPPAASPPMPAASPTAVPGAEGRVTTSTSVLVTDDGDGPWMCWSGNIGFGGGGKPHVCDAARVAGWDWRTAGESTTEGGVRQGWFTLTGTFDGTTFTVEKATQPRPVPHEWDFAIPCSTPEGGWQVLDATRSGQDDLHTAIRLTERLDGFAMAAVSTSEGEPGPRDPSDTVLSLYVAGESAPAEAAVREVWGGMLCVSEVEHSHRELTKVQQALLDVPGTSEVGSGNPENQVELVVFHDDGSIQRWADAEFGDGVVVVESILQPVG